LDAIEVAQKSRRLNVTAAPAAIALRRWPRFPAGLTETYARLFQRRHCEIVKRLRFFGFVPLERPEQ